MKLSFDVLIYKLQEDQKRLTCPWFHTWNIEESVFSNNGNCVTENVMKT